MDNFELWYRANRAKFASGAPPLTFQGTGQPTKNWTIYGHTSANLFDVSAVSDDSGIDRDTGEIVESSGSSVSDWIAYDSDQSLFISSQRIIAAATSIIFAFYDSEKNYIDWVGVVFLSGQHSYEVTDVPISAAFFRVQFFDDGFSNVMINQGETVLPYEPFGAVGDKTDNLFYRTAEMDISTNWVGGKFYPERPNSVCYFIFFPLPTEVKSILKSESNISVKVFLKDHGQYFNGMVFALTPEIVGTVTTEYRVLQNNGTIIDFTQNVSDWDDIYLSLGYGQGVINPPISVDRREQIIRAFFDNFDLSIISGITMPEAYEPYGYKIPITCGGETTNIYIGDTPLSTGQTVTGSETGVAIPTVDGENTLSIGTTVQPSKVVISAASGMSESVKKYFDYKYGVLKMAGIKE